MRETNVWRFCVADKFLKYCPKSYTPVHIVSFPCFCWSSISKRTSHFLSPTTILSTSISWSCPVPFFPSYNRHFTKNRLFSTRHHYTISHVCRQEISVFLFLKPFPQIILNLFYSAYISRYKAVIFDPQKLLWTKFPFSQSLYKVHTS